MPSGAPICFTDCVAASRITADSELEQLYEELKAYPGVQLERPHDGTSAADIVLPLRFQHPHGELTFLSTISTFGTANDITLAELAIEAFYPANARTATALRDGLAAS